VLQFLKSSALKPMRTSIRSPWQNGVAERWVGSARRELLDHVIPLKEYHLRRLGHDYLAYYHQDRTHIGLNKNTPAERAVERRSRLQIRIVSTARLGGPHHRYRWSEAA
jgi:transposase InsO family protein